MAEKRSRRRFTAEFKAQAVGRLLDGGRGLSEVATELGLYRPQLVRHHVEAYAASAVG
jgi:transposase-like protein